MKELYQQLSIAYSYLGKLCLDGNSDALKFLYLNICFQHPALIKTLNQLVLRLTSIELQNDSGATYNSEFLYFFGMTCMGIESQLIVKNLETSKTCFKQIQDTVPKARARLAYIALLESAEPHGSDENAHCINTLREYAGQNDNFSSIALAKITYEHFLAGSFERESSELPSMAIELLYRPCKLGYPEAIRFYNAMLSNIGFPNKYGLHINKDCINTSSLCDFPDPIQICK